MATAAGAAQVALTAVAAGDAAEGVAVESRDGDGGLEEAAGDGIVQDHPDGSFIVDLVDADNGFNNQSRLAMLWTVRHRWDILARFTMNFYRHYMQVIVQVPGKEPHILLSREGTIQGCTFGMILYGIGILPLVERI